MEYPEQQAAYDWLVERWSRFEQRPFPRGSGGAEAEGVCLVMLDADMAGLVSSYVQRRRQFRRGGIDQLRRLHDHLRRVLPSLVGEAANYFAELDWLAATTLGLLDKDDSG